MDRAQIIAIFRAQYGEKVLSAPTTQGFNLLAWVMPFAAIVAGGGADALAIGKLRAAPRPATPAAVPVFDPTCAASSKTNSRSGLTVFCRRRADRRRSGVVRRGAAGRRPDRARANPPANSK